MSRHPSKKVPLNDFWIPGDGIEREVLQASIQNWLGADSTCAPMVKDVRLMPLEHEYIPS